MNGYLPCDTCGRPCPIKQGLAIASENNKYFFCDTCCATAAALLKKAKGKTASQKELLKGLNAFLKKRTWLN